MSALTKLRLGQAPQSEPFAVYRQIESFLDHFDDINVRKRALEEILPTVQNGRFFFVKMPDASLCATTGFYCTPVGDQEIAELGSVLVDPPIRGHGLQTAMWRYIIAQEWLSENWPSLGVYAIVRDGAVGSWKSVESCGFDRASRIPSHLQKISPTTRNDILIGRKRLYTLNLNGVADALDFVASNGAEIDLERPADGAKVELQCAFPAFRKLTDQDRQELRNEAGRVRGLAQASVEP